MFIFTQGVIDAGGTLDKDDAELELSKDLRKMKLPQPINLDAASDAPEEPAMRANQIYDFGLAGIAWYLSGGDPDLALLYLDMRGSGTTSRLARARIEEIIDSRGFEYKMRVQSKQSEIYNATYVYRLHLEKTTSLNHNRSLLKPGSETSVGATTEAALRLPKTSISRVLQADCP